MFDGLPFELEMLYGELDGTFPNHPADPIQPENLRDLQARVLETGADVGLAFDGDADRVFLVDEQAEPLSGSTTTAIVAKAHAREAPGRDDPPQPHLLEGGARGHRARTAARRCAPGSGHSFIKEVMAETGAVFGGEHSGHYYFRDNFRADSGLIAALVVLEQLCRGRRAAVRAAQAVRALRRSGEINTEVDDPRAVIERVAGRVRRRRRRTASTGSPSTCGDWWFNLRPSNTEPLLRLNLEAPTRDDVRRARRRGARPLDRPTEEVLTPWRSTRSCSRSSPAPRTRARCSTSRTRTRSTTLGCKRRYAIRDDIPVMLIDEAETVDDAEHERLLAKAEAEGITPDLRGLT